MQALFSCVKAAFAADICAGLVLSPCALSEERSRCKGGANPPLPNLGGVT